MTQVEVVRLFQWRPTGPAFDTALRERLLPDFVRLPGIVRAWAGRQGPDELGRRALVSLWATQEAMAAALGEEADDRSFHPDELDLTTGRTLDVLPVLLVAGHVAMATTTAPQGAADVPPAPVSAGILRIARGRVSGDLERYADGVWRGLAQDREHGVGPSALVMARAGDASFLTVSTWPDWASIEAATGATREVPIRTKRSDQLVSFEADHFELIGP